MVALILAATFAIEFIGPCSNEPLLKGHLSAFSSEQTVGEVTIRILEENRVPYLGNERGINSAFGTPIGLEALEIISDQEMRSYGWCYEVDGVVPEVFADEVFIKDIKKVRWYFAYAHYRRGQWVGQCQPAYKIRPAFLCK